MSELWNSRLYADFSVTYIYRVYISFMEGVHVAIWQKSVGEQGEQNELRKSEKFVAGQCETSSSAGSVSVLTQQA